MSLETELRARLVADGTVFGLVAQRLYPLVLPQGVVYPAVRYQRISGPRYDHLRGASGFGEARIQIDSFASSYVGAQALAAAIRASLHGFFGVLTTLRVSIALDNEIDDIEPSAQAGGADVYRVIQDFKILHSE